jgi:hypothetical protein
MSKKVNFRMLLFLVLFIEASEISLAQQSIGKKQQGVCFVGGKKEVTEKEIAQLKKCNVTWISQTPFAFQRDANSSDIRTNFSSGRIWWGESDEGISITTQLARKAEIHSLLKPHLWVSKSWPGEIRMKSDTAWQRWFRLYEKFIVHYAELAEKNKIEIFCIGTELHQTLREKEWRAIIKNVRKVYKGKLTYAANFNKEFEEVMFWDALDYIGIQAYFPLAKNEKHTLGDLRSGWQNHLVAIERIQKKYSRPVIFTEIGYRSDTRAAIEPWTWPSEKSTAVPSEQAQADCYHIFFQSVWNKEWLAGAYFWKWYPHGTGRLNEVDFTPQGKLAEKVMTENFWHDDQRH